MTWDDMPSEANRPDGKPAPDRSAYDAAPPSAEEAKAEHRRKLAAEGCKECGEDDPDKLHRVVPDVGPAQLPAFEDPTFVICDDCRG